MPSKLFCCSAQDQKLGFSSNYSLSSATLLQSSSDYYYNDQISLVQVVEMPHPKGKNGSEISQRCCWHTKSNGWQSASASEAQLNIHSNDMHFAESLHMRRRRLPYPLNRKYSIQSNLISQPGTKPAPHWIVVPGIYATLTLLLSLCLLLWHFRRSPQARANLKVSGRQVIPSLIVSRGFCFKL